MLASRTWRFNPTSYCRVLDTKMSFRPPKKLERKRKENLAIRFGEWKHTFNPQILRHCRANQHLRLRLWRFGIARDRARWLFGIGTLPLLVMSHSIKMGYKRRRNLSRGILRSHRMIDIRYIFRQSFGSVIHNCSRLIFSSIPTKCEPLRWQGPRILIW